MTINQQSIPDVDAPDVPEGQDSQGMDENEPVDYGEWNESLPEELQDILKRLCQKVCDEYKYPRRLEVRDAWRARCYWRELQHLSWNWEGDCWDVLGGAGFDQSDPQSKRNSAVLYSTNTFQGFGESFIAIITQAVPNMRFEPEDVTEAADIETAKIADDFRKYIQHENDPIKLMTKTAYYAWTDGRIHGATEWVEDPRTHKFREFQFVVGSMECKVPVICEDQKEYGYIQYSKEYSDSCVRSMVRKRGFEPDYYKKIRGGGSGNGQDMYERTARISVKQGISMKSAGGDMYSHLCTVQRTWLRSEQFLSDEVSEELLPQLEKQFPDGVRCEFSNGVYLGSKNESMDDVWVVENIMEGDGAFRNAKGTCLVSVQERINDTINIVQDTYEKNIPASHWDDEMFDVDGMNEQPSMPGARYGINKGTLQPGEQVGGHVFFEPAATISPDQLAYLKELMTDIPEFLTGISAILFGSDTSQDKSGKALSIQQAAAMGRIGLPFRVMKRFYARMMEQAIRCAARNREDDINTIIPDEQGRSETVTIAVGDLTGNVRVYPDVDEQYPETMTTKRAILMQLMQEAAQDPLMKSILSNPKNQNMIKKWLGLQDLELPQADSWNKQMVEINLMLEEPAHQEQQPPKAMPNPLVPEQIEIIQPPAQPQSSIPIDPVYDDNAAEFLTVSIWINSGKGQQAKKKNPGGFENVRLHGLEHKQALQATMQPPPGAPPAGAPAPAPAA